MGSPERKAVVLNGEMRRALREQLWLLEEVTKMLEDGRAFATGVAYEVIRRQLRDVRSLLLPA